MKPKPSRSSRPANWLRIAAASLVGALAPLNGLVAQSPWETLNVGTTASFRGLSVVDDRVVWASGTRGTVIHTIDGGGSWTVDSIPNGVAFDLRGIHARNDRVAHVAATAGRIWRTTDGGKTWSLRYQAADTSMFLDAIVFVNDRVGMALGDPMGGRFVLLVTRDGGDTWAEAPTGSRPEAMDGEAAFAASGTSLVFAGQRHGWLGTGGSVARVFRTMDAGASWSVSSSAIPGRGGSAGVFSVAFADSLRGIVVGGDYQLPDSATSTAAFTTDGGATWQPSGTFPRGFRSGVAVRQRRDELIAIAVGTTGSDISRDGGRTWSPLDGTAFNAIQFAPSGVAYAVGARGRVARHVVR